MEESAADTGITNKLDGIELQARLRIGTTLVDKWRLDVLLGVGGMAAVYAATHRNGTRAAIKILHNELSVVSAIRSRFMREGLVANTIAHPGAVRVLDEDRAEDGSVFLVMELLDGESLDARAARHGGKLPIEEVLSAIDPILDTLKAAHEKGIIHRDLKPANVFLTRDGEMKLLDFGIARLRELSTASSATHTGATMGTPAFMPPEQARGLWDEVDPRSDLWAVGAMAFNLITGRRVHEGRTPNEVLLSAMTKPAPQIRSIDSTIPSAVAEMIDRALSYERDDRWPDATSMQEAVRVAFQLLSRVPLSEAPKLVVPAQVPDRTFPIPEHGHEPAPLKSTSDVTAQPVAGGVSGAEISHTGRKLFGLGKMVPAIVATVAIALIGTALGFGLRKKQSPSSETTTAAAAAAPITSIVPEASMPEPTSSVLPIDPASLPIASSGPPARPKKAARPSPSATLKDWKDQRR